MMLSRTAFASSMAQKMATHCLDNRGWQGSVGRQDFRCPVANLVHILLGEDDSSRASLNHILI
jgi:hypothetical protein